MRVGKCQVSSNIPSLKEFVESVFLSKMYKTYFQKQNLLNIAFCVDK